MGKKAMAVAWCIVFWAVGTLFGIAWDMVVRNEPRILLNAVSTLLGIPLYLLVLWLFERRRRPPKMRSLKATYKPQTPPAFAMPRVAA